MMKSIRTCLLPLLLCCLVLTGCQGAEAQPLSFSLDDVPAYSGEPYVVLDDNEPAFSQEDRTSTTSFESYSPLDALGRCGTAYANVGTDLMPTEDRGEIGQVKPTGWHTVKYDCVDGKYLYNRCHLIGYQLTGENANEENLITGTRYLNVDGMLPFENLVASGVQMEGWSVEDEGDGVCFNVYVYNVQPGVTIDYATGESTLASDAPETGTATDTETTTGEDTAPETETAETTYILNTSSHKFHLPDCPSVSSMKEANKSTYTGSREDLIAQGYEPCGQCKP